MSGKTWGGRFSDKTDPSVEAFTSSIDIDKRLYSCDIEGSIAHCSMLAEKSIITKEDASVLIKGLDAIKEEIVKIPHHVYLNRILCGIGDCHVKRDVSFCAQFS